MSLLFSLQLIGKHVSNVNFASENVSFFFLIQKHFLAFGMQNLPLKMCFPRLNWEALSSATMFLSLAKRKVGHILEECWDGVNIKINNNLAFQCFY